MEFSILITVDGNKISRDPYDGDIVWAFDLCHEFSDAGLMVDDEISEPGDSEYTYNADKWGNSPLIAAAIDVLRDQRASDPERFARWALGRWPDCGDLWWASLSRFQASGILSRDNAERLLERLGAVASDCDTMGTLGGPASPMGLAPDMVYEVESQSMVVSIRVTPLSERINSQDRWDRVKRAIVATHGKYNYSRA